MLHASAPHRGGKKDCVLLSPGCQVQPFHYFVSASPVLMLPPPNTEATVIMLKERLHVQLHAENPETRVFFRSAPFEV